MQAAVALVGYKKSGKTSLAVALAREFQSRGFSVAAAKCAHTPLDKPQTDTDQLHEVCDVVAGLGPTETTVAWSSRHYLADLLPLLQADVLLVEGCKDQKWLPRILLSSPEQPADAALEPELALGCWGTPHFTGMPVFTEVPELAQHVLEHGFLLPGLDCGACGRKDCAGLTRDIVAGKVTPAACQARKADLSVKVNGQELGLNPFVRDIIGGSIRGMLSQLKGYAPGTIDITMEA